MEAMDELAVALRGRLVERARAGEAGGGTLDERVRALVEREAAPLAEAERAALCERVVVLATGLGPLDPLLADPEVDEVMVNGPGEVYVERRGRLERGGGELRLGGGAAARDRAHPRAAWGGAWTRPRRSATRACPTARA